MTNILEDLLVQWNVIRRTIPRISIINPTQQASNDCQNMQYLFIISNSVSAKQTENGSVCIQKLQLYAAAESTTMHLVSQELKRTFNFTTAAEKLGCATPFKNFFVIGRVV
jgi:hypothetical protein